MTGFGGSKPRERVRMRASTGYANPILKAGYLNKTCYEQVDILKKRTLGRTVSCRVGGAGREPDSKSYVLATTQVVFLPPGPNLD